MSLFKRGKKGIWWYEFEFSGHRYRESTKTTSRSLAEKAERKRHRDLEAAGAGVRVEKARPVLFSVATDEWLKLKGPTISAKTLNIYTAEVAVLKAYFGALLVTDITARDIVDYITARRQTKSKKTKAKTADKSIRNELGTLRAVLKKHKRWEAIKEDIRLPKGREDVGVALTTEQEEALLKACAASRSRSLYPAVELALNTGLRHDEIRLLRWRQVDFANESIIVGKSKTEHGTGRPVPMNQRALKVMKDWAGAAAQAQGVALRVPVRKGRHQRQR